jgi:hypothetical protein
MIKLCYTTVFEDEDGNRVKIWTREPLLGIRAWKKQRETGKPIKVVGITSGK